MGICDRRIEVFGKIHMGGRRVAGVKVVVIEELKFLGKFTKKIIMGGGGGGRGVWSGRVDVKEDLKFFMKI